MILEVAALVAFGFLIGALVFWRPYVWVQNRFLRREIGYLRDRLKDLEKAKVGDPADWWKR